MLGTHHFKRRLLTFSIFTVGFFICSILAVLASDFSGSVVSVLDGDTIEILNGHHAERIRLSGIDCPEKGQALSPYVVSLTAVSFRSPQNRFRFTPSAPQDLTHSNITIIRCSLGNVLSA